MNSPTKTSSARRSAKITKSTSRASKRLPTSHDHSPIVADGRHKRVWKACERCRMKKTKCDGESPCQRCKDDGLICTAGSRKKTEFKTMPRGYAEVLENNQYSLTATVYKLYQMVQNGEPWKFGKPEANDKGQPSIHYIASKLGCVRQSLDLPQDFPENEQEFHELRVKLEAEDPTISHNGEAEPVESLFSSPEPCSEGSDPSSGSPDSPWSPPQQDAAINSMLPSQYMNLKLETSQAVPALEEVSPPYSHRTSSESITSRPSPLYPSFQPESATSSPYCWPVGDEFPASNLSEPAPYSVPNAFQYMQSQPPMISSTGHPVNPKSSILKPYANELNFMNDTLGTSMAYSNSYSMDQMDQMDQMMFMHETAY